MLDRKEIEIEISRLEYGESSYPAYAKLANLYTIRDQMDKSEQPEDPQSASLVGYSQALEPPLRGSDFLDLVAGKDPALVWEVLDDLMDTLSATNPRAYRGVMRRLEDL